MTDLTTTRLRPATEAFAPVLAMLVLGLALLFTAGHAGSAALHTAAHDARHAAGFPCN
jgi:cobalt transporter subunit CbtB